MLLFLHQNDTVSALEFTSTTGSASTVWMRGQLRNPKLIPTVRYFPPANGYGIRASPSTEASNQARILFCLSTDPFSRIDPFSRAPCPLRFRGRLTSHVSGQEGPFVLSFCEGVFFPRLQGQGSGLRPRLFGFVSFGDVQQAWDKRRRLSASLPRHLVLGTCDGSTRGGGEGEEATEK